MNQGFKLYLTVWMAALALFNTIAFVSVSAIGNGEFTTSFWIGYSLITACMLGNPICARLAFKAPDAKRTFYKLSLVQSSYVGLIVSFLSGALCMLIPDFPYYISIIICAIALFLNILSVTGASGAVSEIERIDKKIATRTSFIRELTLSVDNLIQLSPSEEISALCRPVYEKARYSDPMSSEALSEIEASISEALAEMADAVKRGDTEKVKTSAKALAVYLDSRSKRCKSLK